MEENNKRKHIIRLSLVAMLLILAFTVFVAPVSAADRHVGPYQTYSTIQSAVNAANPGDTIIVHDTGTFPDYVEKVSVTKNNLIIKVAAGEDVTVKAANANDNVFEVLFASRVRIDFFDIYGATNGCGILLLGSSDCRSTGNRCRNNLYGISLVHSNNNKLVMNTYNSNTVNGICLCNSSNNNLCCYNSCEDNGVGIHLGNGSNRNYIYDNTYSENGVGIHMEGVDSNVILENDVSNNEYGIEVCRSCSNAISGNDIFFNEHGIWLCEYSTSNRIRGNRLWGNRGDDTGVHLTSETENNIILGNTFIDNEPYQAWDDGTDNTWEGNCWSDYTPPGPYSIPGTASSTDSSPSVPVISCDASGTERNTFDLSESVYCYAGNLPPNDPEVDIYVVPNKAWAVGDPIGDDVGDGVDNVSTDSSGDIGVTLIWSAPLTAGEYDIVIDVNQNGILDAGEAIDGLSTVEGFEAVPEFTTIAIPVAAVLGLVFLMSRRSRHSRRKN